MIDKQDVKARLLEYFTETKRTQVEALQEASLSLINLTIKAERTHQPTDWDAVQMTAQRVSSLKTTDDALNEIGKVLPEISIEGAFELVWLCKSFSVY